MFHSSSRNEVRLSPNASQVTNAMGLTPLALALDRGKARAAEVLQRHLAR
jgi:hypothetical protein